MNRNEGANDASLVDLGMWKSIRALDRRRIPAGASKLGGPVRTELLQ